MRQSRDIPELGGRGAGQNRLHAHAFVFELVLQRLREGQDKCFRAAIGLR